MMPVDRRRNAGEMCPKGFNLRPGCGHRSEKCATHMVAAQPPCRTEKFITSPETVVLHKDNPVVAPNFQLLPAFALGKSLARRRPPQRNNIPCTKSRIALEIDPGMQFTICPIKDDGFLRQPLQAGIRMHGIVNILTLLRGGALHTIELARGRGGQERCGIFLQKALYRQPVTQYHTSGRVQQIHVRTAISFWIKRSLDP